MPIVSRETFDSFIAAVSGKSCLSVDTETTGLFPYRGHELFSIIIGADSGVWYLNFKEYPGCPANLILDKTHFEILQKEIFDEKNKRYYLHNAKFDLAFLRKCNIELRGFVHDTASIYRLINNEAHIKFSLENCVKHLGVEKSNAVEEFIADHGLWEWVQIPGKKMRQKNKFFYEVPLDIMSNYGLTDGDVTHRLGEWQIEELTKLEKQAEILGIDGYREIYANERKLTKTVFEMEWRGVRIDRDYCVQSADKLGKTLAAVAERFTAETGVAFSDSPKIFSGVFKNENLTYGKITKTGKQNPKFDSDALETFTHPAAKTVLEYRAVKSKHDFFQGFLYFADKDSILHTSFNQDGTATGRFSSNNPNLQNLEKTEGEDLKADIVVRRAVLPRPRFFFAMFDYDQMEYRLMLDIAEAHSLIAKVLGGLDVHQATADLAGITRAQAKTVNFGVLYGMGDAALAAKLKTSIEEARRIKAAIFNAAPEILELIESAKYWAEKRGYVTNWYGRRNYFPIIQTENFTGRLTHKAVNYLIQGGCADVVKIAMNKINGFLADKQSKLVLTIHDELVIETHESEKHILPDIKRIMETVYPSRHLPLTVGCDHSYKSLADKVEGFPP